MEYKDVGCETYKLSQLTLAFYSSICKQFDEYGSFVEAENVDEDTKREYLIHCESIFDSLVWVSKTPIVNNFNLRRQSLIESSIAKDIMSAKNYKSEKNYSECLKSLSKAVMMDFNNPFYLADRAEVYIILGDIQSAVQNYSRAVFLYQSSPVFRSRLAKLYCFQGQAFLDFRMYHQAFKAFLKASKWDPEQLIYKAKSFSCQVKMNCMPQAWATLTSLIHEYPDNLDLIVMKARLRHLSGEYALAFYDLESIAENKDCASVRAMLETIKNKAKKYWQVAIKLNMRQDFNPAIKKINLAIKLWPTQAKFYFLRGVLYRHINKFTLSIDDLILALQKSTPEEKETFASDAEKQLLLTFNDFSVECFTNGYFDDAIQLLNKAISVEKMQKGLYLNRAECFYQKGDYHFALQDYEQALELDPLDRKYFPRISELSYLLALQYYTDRNFEESVVKLDKAVSYSPISGQLYILRAKCKRMLQDLCGARHDILLGFHLMPTSKDILPVFGYLFPSIPTKHILTSPQATQARVLAEELLSDPLHQSIERTFSFTADENSVLTSLITDPLTVLGNQPPTLLQPSFCSTPDLLQEKKRISTKIKQVHSNKDLLQPSDHKLTTSSNASLWETAFSKFATDSKTKTLKIPSAVNSKMETTTEREEET
eukprot:XP_014787110.1 PREDICTED: tetratricopeptide repeat protein 16-like [Octopus bimaculoides]